MFFRKKKGWETPEREATGEDVYRKRRSIIRGARDLSRRDFLKTSGAYGLGAGLAASGLTGVLGLFDDGEKENPIKVPETPTSYLYPARRNPRYKIDRPLTDEEAAATYNNFYEFSTTKKVWDRTERIEPRPWTVEIGGLVEKPMTLDMDDLVRKMPLEERVYRFRCVEAWAMAVPWTGFPMKALVRLANPLSSAKFVRMQTFHKPSWSLNQRLLFWHPWPYTEGLTMDEATNELTMIATGIYGHELPAQHGTPLRLIVPWKYGFKNVKSIVRIDFTDETPRTFWPEVVPGEYHFTANVNPHVPHPRWSQKTERMLGSDERRPTMKYNGYGEYVAQLYEKG